jgi:glycosyltransferase involved in cell wall biosynthesis
MKVLQVGSNSIHVKLFVKAMANHGIECALLSEEPIDGFSTVQFSFRSSNPLHWIINYLKLVAYLKSNRPDVVHIHQVNRLAVFVTRACEKLNIKVVLTAWGSDVLLVPQRNWFNKFLVSSALKKANIITADADAMIDAIKTLAQPLSKEIHSIQYGIDPITPATIKENIIFSNRLHKPLYQVDKIISDFHVFHQQHPDWKLVIGGVGEETDSLKEQVIKNHLTDSVEFVGWLNAEQNAHWYSRAKIYVSIPESDGMSVSVLEALSAECIPVCSDIVVTHSWMKDGVNGIIRKSNANPFNEAIAINHDNCIKQNKEWVSSFAYRSATIPRFIAIYKKLIA